MKFQIKAFPIYEKGHYRDTQEDTIFPQSIHVTPSDRLFMVCDGMGGHESGEVASQAVCEAMSRVILQMAPSEEVLTDEILSQALTEAYNLLDERDPNPNSEKKMGTTMTLLKLHREGATIAHIGDSRVYQLRPDEEGIMQVVHKTIDHSLVNDLLKVGELTPEEAENFPRKNIITRAMQSHLERRPKADVTHIEDVRAGDYFFLCSDGMLEHTSDQNLCYMIGLSGTDDEKKIKMLKETTEDNKDNHSAYLIHIIKAEKSILKKTSETDEHSTQTTSKKSTTVQSARKRTLLYYIAAGVSFLLIVAAAYFYATKTKNISSHKLHEKEKTEKPAVKDTSKTQTTKSETKSETEPEIKQTKLQPETNESTHSEVSPSATGTQNSEDQAINESTESTTTSDSDTQAISDQDRVQDKFKNIFKNENKQGK